MVSSSTWKGSTLFEQSGHFNSIYQMQETSPESREPSVETELLCMKVKYWWYAVMLCQGWLFVFMMGCLGSYEWVRQGKDESEWEGGLLGVNFGPENYRGESYSSLADDVCDREGYEELCDSFENLKNAGAVFIFFEVLSILMLAAWAARVVFALKEKKFLGEWIGYLFPGLGFLLHFLGVIVWVAVSGAKFSSECYGQSELCNTYGPTLGVLTILFYFFFAALYSFVFFKREGIYAKQEDEKSVS